MVGGRIPLGEDDLRWKTTFSGEATSKQGRKVYWLFSQIYEQPRCYGKWKATFRGTQPRVEEDLRWKMTLGGRRPSMEDNLRWKTTFDGNWPLMKDGLWWNKIFDRRQPLTEDGLWQKTILGFKSPSNSNCPIKIAFDLMFFLTNSM